MDSYSKSSNSVSSSSSSYNSYSSNFPTHFPAPRDAGKKAGRPPSAYRSSLHSIRKNPNKNNIMKKPIAPFPPTPPKIYNVDPISFRDVVQKLTSAPEFQSTRLQEVAPPPLSLSPPRIRHPNCDAMPEESHVKSFDQSTFGALSPLGFCLSPSSLAWCSSFLFSPTTLSSLDANPVL